MSDADAPRRRFNVGAVKLPYRERDVAHAVITGEDLHDYRDVMGADTDDADEKFPVGANTAYAVDLTEHEADLFAAASNCRYIEESEAALPERAVGRPTGTLHIPPLDTLAWLRTRYVDLRRWHGRDVRVAILDQGTTKAVRDAMGWTLVARTNVGNAPLGPGQELVEPDHLHGCLVAPNGVPAGGLLLDAIISNDTGSAPDSNMSAGIIWAVDNGAKVINLSWNYADSAAAPQVLVDACTYARNNGGVQITWSAGNADLTDLQRPANLSRTQSNVHSIIAFDPATDRRSFFSSHHAEGSGCTPGVDSLSLDIFGNPTRWNGTSSAAPHAAMLMAMAMTGGQFTPTQVGAAFKANCRNTGATASDQGGGAYDLHRALSALGAGPTLATSVGNVSHVDSRGVATTANSYSLTPAAGIQPDDLQIMALISSHDAKLVLPPGAVLLADAPYKAAYEQGDALSVSPSRLRILVMPYTADQSASVLLSFGGAGWFSAFGVMTLRGAGGLDPERFVPTTKFAASGGSLDTVPVVPATPSDLQVCIFSQRHPSASTGTLSLPSGLTQRGFWRPSAAGAGYTLLMATRQLTDGNRTPSYVSTSNDSTGTWATCTFTVPAGPADLSGPGTPTETVARPGAGSAAGRANNPTAGGTTSSRAFFQAADWLWNPIPASPVIDPQSASIVSELSTQNHSLIVDQFAAKIVHPSEITGATPRYTITVKNATGGSSGENWGPSPFAGYSMPIPNGVETQIPPGDGSYFDGHVAVGDPAQNVAACMWQAEKVSGVWRCSWGGRTSLNGDGREFPATGISTGSGLSRFGAVIRESEVAAGVINHALFFGSNMVTLRGSGPVDGVNYRYPATTTDGDSPTGTTFTIPQGARIRLKPTATLGAGASPIETMIFNCLKTYGAYCGDETSGTARMAFVMERKPGSSVYSSAGVFDYLDMTRIPWSQMEVLRRWDGL